jgi:hypothetical protein
MTAQPYRPATRPLPAVREPAGNGRADARAAGSLRFPLTGRSPCVPGSRPARPPHRGVNGVMPSGRQAEATAAGAVRPAPAARCAADADLFPPEIVGLLTVARAELDRHVNDHGRCRACKAPFPCQRACLAEQTLGWF